MSVFPTRRVCRILLTTQQEHDTTYLNSSAGIRYRSTCCSLPSPPAPLPTGSQSHSYIDVTKIFKFGWKMAMTDRHAGNDLWKATTTCQGKERLVVREEKVIALVADPVGPLLFILLV